MDIGQQAWIYNKQTQDPALAKDIRYIYSILAGSLDCTTAFGRALQSGPGAYLASFPVPCV